MSPEIDALTRALLHEGHLLYPYDPRAPKNRHRWLFGRLYPEGLCRSYGGGESAWQETECLVTGPEGAEIAVQARGLQVAAGEGLPADAILREIDAGAHPLGALEQGPSTRPFTFPAGPAGDGRSTQAISGRVEIEGEPVGGEAAVWKIRVRIGNTTPLPDGAWLSDDEALLLALVSTHAVITVRGGAFVPPRDPPADLADLARSCRSRGAYPILVGPTGSRQTMLCSPIILDDWPRIAPESSGDLFDAVEIEELLTLHILALSEDEKRASSTDDRAAALIRRAEALGPEARLALHGRLVKHTHAPLGPGRRVVLRPRGRADILDVALTGKTATVQKVETDFEGRVHVAVTVDDDPGRDLGERGHQFYFDPAEVEPIDADPEGDPR